jgi:hypothetical protein
MGDPLPYIGAIGGLVGGIAGVTGAIMGVIAYRRTGEFKALDLRVRLRTSESDLRAELERLPEILDSADNAWRRLHAAEGNSGRAQVWQRGVAADRASLETLRAPWLAPPPDYSALPNGELESRIVAVHTATSQAVALRQKYEAEIEAARLSREAIAEARQRQLPG